MRASSDIGHARLVGQLRRLASEEFREFREELLKGMREKARVEMQQADPHTEVPRLQGRAIACDAILKVIENSTRAQQPDLNPEMW